MTGKDFFYRTQKVWTTRQHFINWTEKFKSLALPKTILRRWKSKPKSKLQYGRKCSQYLHQIKVLKFSIYFKNLWQNIQRKTIIQKDTYTPVFTAALFTIARTWKQPTCPSADEWIRKLWYICKMEYYSAIKKNTFQSVLMRWMKLEPIIQSEVSQKEKHQYSILTHICQI